MAQFSIQAFTVAIVMNLKRLVQKNFGRLHGSIARLKGLMISKKEASSEIRGPKERPTRNLKVLQDT